LKPIPWTDELVISSMSRFEKSWSANTIFTQIFMVMWCDMQISYLWHYTTVPRTF
jgi:hypothetical protein